MLIATPTWSIVVSRMKKLVPCKRHFSPLRKRLRNAFVQLPNLLPVSGHDVAVMLEEMVSVGRSQSQVLQAVVRLDAVPVMDEVSGRDASMSLFPNDTMFPWPSPLPFPDFDLNVSAGAYSLGAYWERFHFKPPPGFIA